MAGVDFPFFLCRLSGVFFFEQEEVERAERKSEVAACAQKPKRSVYSGTKEQRDFPAHPHRAMSFPAVVLPDELRGKVKYVIVSDPLVCALPLPLPLPLPMRARAGEKVGEGL